MTRQLVVEALDPQGRVIIRHRTDVVPDECGIVLTPGTLVTAVRVILTPDAGHELRHEPEPIDVRTLADSEPVTVPGQCRCGRRWPCPLAEPEPLARSAD